MAVADIIKFPLHESGGDTGFTIVKGQVAIITGCEQLNNAPGGLTTAQLKPAWVSGDIWPGFNKTGNSN